MKTLLWDFDGTLGYRHGGAWTGSLLEVLDRELPNHGITMEQIRPYTRGRYPWDIWEQPHKEWTDAEIWWQAIEPLFVYAYEGVGLSTEQARALSPHFRATYLDLTRWRCFKDVMPTLETLSEHGWSHAILSNHVPELYDIVEHLGLMRYVTHVFNSADMGYEKPHPRIYAQALTTLPSGAPHWMIGDNFFADVQGAEKMGLSGILVRRPNPEARYYAETLMDVVNIVKYDSGTQPSGKLDYALSTQ